MLTTKLLLLLLLLLCGFHQPAGTAPKPLENESEARNLMNRITFYCGRYFSWHEAVRAAHEVMGSLLEMLGISVDLLSRMKRSSGHSAKSNVGTEVYANHMQKLHPSQKQALARVAQGHANATSIKNCSGKRSNLKLIPGRA